METSTAGQLYWNVGGYGRAGNRGSAQGRMVVCSPISKGGSHSSSSWCSCEMKVSAAENDLLFRLVNGVLGYDEG